MSREAIFLGKAIADLVFVAAVQLIAIPALVIFYDLPLGDTAAAWRRLLPMLALPFYVPIVIAAAQAASKLLSGQPVAEAGAWLKLLLAFDIVSWSPARSRIPQWRTDETIPRMVPSAPWRLRKTFRTQ